MFRIKLTVDRYKDYDAKMVYPFQRVIEYIERCHLEDGGYFFARVQPSSNLDTYFAVKSLSIMGLKPAHPETIVDFFLNYLKDSNLSSLPGIFLTVEVLNELGSLTNDIRAYVYPKIMSYSNKLGGFGVYQNLNLDVTSELQETYRAVKTLRIINKTFNEQKVIQFVSNMLNPDGGYGREGTSTLASTFFATRILSLLSTDTQKLDTSKDYLRWKEENWQLHFIEDMYWLTMSYINLGEKPSYPERIVNFIVDCQRSNGGFSRATVMGIPTLEYTYYALSILKVVNVL